VGGRRQLLRLVAQASELGEPHKTIDIRHQQTRLFA
jgi:hypothetical protein